MLDIDHVDPDGSEKLHQFSRQVGIEVLQCLDI